MQLCIGLTILSQIFSCEINLEIIRFVTRKKIFQEFPQKHLVRYFYGSFVRKHERNLGTILSQKVTTIHPATHMHKHVHSRTPEL